MILKINLSLLFLIAGLFATHGVAQEQKKPASLVGTYQTGHRFGGSALTVNADGSYVMSGLRVGMQLLARDEEPSPWSGAKVVSVTKNSAVIRTSGEIIVGDKLNTKYVSRIYR